MLGMKMMVMRALLLLLSLRPLRQPWEAQKETSRYRREKDGGANNVNTIMIGFKIAELPKKTLQPNRQHRLHHVSSLLALNFESTRSMKRCT